MAIDKLNFSGATSGSENNLISKKTIGDRLMEYGANLNEQENAREKLRLLEEDKAYQRGRDALQDARQDKKDKRLDLETAAQDLYKNELFKGQQTKGGSYGDALATDSNKYDLTQTEQTNMQKYFANGIYDTNAMRKSGDNILADKIDWQNKASSNVGSFIESGVGKESRPEMYDRIGSVLASKGLLIPESLVTSADQARLAEAKSEEDKLKDIETQRSDILKRSREDNWKQVNAKTNSNGETVYDADGNELQVGRRTANSLQKEFKTGVDNTGDSIKIIQESINKLDKIEPEKKADAISQVNSVINAVAARGIPIDEAARMVSGELTQKGDKSWFFEKFDPAINQKAIDSYADQFVKNMPKKQDATYSSSNNGASKFDLASELVAQNRAADAESLAKLNSDKAKLLAGEETRRANRIDEWLKSQGLKSSEPVKKTSDIKISGSIPDSLIKAEGSRNKPYKDTNGIVTVGVGYAFNKNQDEIERDFKDAKIPLEKINGIKNMDGKTELTNDEIARLTNVSYDRYGVQKLSKIGIDVDNINPTLAEIGVSQAFRGDIVKNGEGYRGELYNFLKNDDLEGMKKYVNTNKNVPKEVKKRLNLVTNAEGPITREQAMYQGIPVAKDLKILPRQEDIINNNTVDLAVENDNVLNRLKEQASNTELGSKEYDELQKQYDIRKNDVVNATRGKQLAATVNSQASKGYFVDPDSPLSTVPNAIKDIGEKSDESIFDMQRMIMNDANKTKDLTKRLYDNLTKKKTLEGKNIVPDRPYGYKQ